LAMTAAGSGANAGFVWPPVLTVGAVTAVTPLARLRGTARAP
jgi:hypothetical protein